MSNQKKILVLTSKTGGGHMSLAGSLRDLLIQDEQGKEEDTNSVFSPGNVTIVDPQPRLFHEHYRLVSRYALWLWAAEFQFFDTPRRSLLAHRVFTHLVSRQLQRLLDELRPDLIITTYPFLSYEVTRVLEQRSSRVPLVMLFSDANGVHASWLSERQAAAVFATTRENYQQALVAGFAPERLHLTGWPVRAQFSRPHLLTREARTATLARLGLDPHRFTFFLQGGGEGAARFNRTIETVLAAGDANLQIILATGSNHALLERYKGTRSLAALPFTPEIAPFMAAADVIMGKAGPNMLFEAVTLGKPFIATACIPGQEEANLPFIQRHGLGWVALHPHEQRALLANLLHNPDQLSAMSATVDAYRRWNNTANQLIVPLLKNLLTASPAEKA
ncbi:MAG TPA: glycosyltransferase [Ktedonobacteraceae bacterium]|nr:glycosyltransferase [Ktedonobacteraceae bacterium]